MEYLEENYTPLLVVGIGYASKKLLKKDLVPVSTWGQMFTTYFTVLGAQILRGVIKKEQDKRNTNFVKPPRPA